MKKKLMMLCFCLIPIMATHVIAAEAGLLPVLFRVGPEVACDFDNLQDALNATKANGPENDVIWISKNHNDTAVAVNINAQSVTINGGYDNCLAFSPSGQTIIDGTGGSIASVLNIFGGTAADQHVVKFQNLTIQGGENDGYGGGLDIQGGMNVRLERVAVINNTSTYGAGISLRGATGASLVITEFSEVLSNTASQDGGGVYCQAGFLGFFSGAIAFNQANNGGGVKVVDGCLFRHQSGGILQGIFLNNANNGGGIHSGNNSTIELTGNSTTAASITSNNATFTGGGVVLRDSIMRAKNAAINSNSADWGGGISIVGNSQFFMEQLPGQVCNGNRCSTLSGNVARVAGALTLNGSGAYADIRQSYIEDNSATELASAIYANINSRLVVEGTVIAQNQGAESVIKLLSGSSALMGFVTMANNNASNTLITVKDDVFSDAEKLEIYSSIFFGSDGTEILRYDSSTEVLVDCIMAYEIASLPTTGAYITVDNPELVNPGDGDYHISMNSPAIDYCDTAAYTPTHQDIDQQDRGIDEPSTADNFLISWFDIGADEWMLPDLIFKDGFE